MLGGVGDGNVAKAAVADSGVDSAATNDLNLRRRASQLAARGLGVPRQRGAAKPLRVRYQSDTEVEVLGPGRPSVARWCRAYGFTAEVLLSSVVGLLVGAVAAPSASPFLVVALGIWAISAFYKGRAVTSPLPRQLRMVAQSILMGLAACALGDAFLSVPEAVARGAIAGVLVAGTVSGLCRVARWRLQSPVRIMLVGDRVAIAQAAARWAPRERVSVVAAILDEPDLDDVPSEILGVPIVTGLDAAPAIVDKVKADLVVVSPGLGFSSIHFRRLAWALEHTKASLGVMGVLDSVSPHRITPGLLEGATVNDVRVPKPSAFIRGVKAAIDRVVGALLLVVVSPLLLIMAVAVRLDSPGKALFTQVRVGRRGRLFKVYKMRTMVEDAERMRAELEAANEYDDVLFKMKHDPRVTRVGAVLRRTSLDELPQLINVVRGQMSLVGPRPSLPSEVDEMDPDTLRRLAVRPGITGLWQVSGRSELSWEEASALDTYYADNWCVVGDVAILARTVKAVVSAKGAY
jgi:exopolysaccharide biosynthesis polyprenyl glycosylphosphotransferase